MSGLTETSNPSLLRLSSSSTSVSRLKKDGHRLLKSSKKQEEVGESIEESASVGTKQELVSDGAGMISPDEEGTLGSSDLSDIPPKATSFSHLSKKYLGELEYMLREFQKLERQLLGAKTLQSTESAGSKERREKLHSFIVHLDDTIQQIRNGCKQAAATNEEASKKANSCSLPKSSYDKTEEESVQKLEEHILANLLPVKVRLKKQLAAQQGAKHNPAGMPVRGVVTEARTTQFGKPLDGGGSSLTQKLHGSKLGSKSRIHGHGVGSEAAKSTDEKRIFFAGMAIGSDQVSSSLQAASSVHQVIVNEQQYSSKVGKQGRLDTSLTLTDPDVDLVTQSATSQLSCEEQRQLRKKKRQKKRLRRQQKQQSRLQSSKVSGKRKKHAMGGTKHGPRSVEYMCGVCNETYSFSCDYNPWWALVQQECPKCRKTQIPRVDINAPANSIEYHPALLAHADDGSNSAAAVRAAAAASKPTPPPAQLEESSDESDSMSDDDDFSEDSLLSDESDLEALEAMSPCDRAELERFGASYSGPRFSDHTAARLLPLLIHANKCPCRHKNPACREACRSAKWMLLHVRDCPGTTHTCDVCPFPWCRKVKHLLYHLVTCTEGSSCGICYSANLNPNLMNLIELNKLRVEDNDGHKSVELKAATQRVEVKREDGDEKTLLASYAKPEIVTSAGDDMMSDILKAPAKAEEG